MPIFPGALIPWIEQRFLDVNGNPLAGGQVFTDEAGTDTPATTYFDSDLAVGHENTNPVLLDAGGRPTTGAIFLQPFGYKFTVADVNGVQQYVLDNVEDLAQVFLTLFGQATGSSNVASGYAVQETDQFITVNGTGGPNPCIIVLPAPAARQTPITIKNLGTVPLAITAATLGQVIEATTGPYTMAAAASPVFPSAIFMSDGVNNYWITASHGLG